VPTAKSGRASRAAKPAAPAEVTPPAESIAAESDTEPAVAEADAVQTAAKTRRAGRSRPAGARNDDTTPVSDEVVVEPLETQIDLGTEPDVEQLTLADSHLAATPFDETYQQADDEATVADLPVAEPVADTQEAGRQQSTRRVDSSAHRAEAEPLSDYEVAAPCPVTRAVPVSFTAEQPKRPIDLAPVETNQDMARSFVPLTVGPAPTFSRLQLSAWLLWGLAVSSVLVAVGLAIWHPVAITGDVFVDRRLMMLCGVGMAAFFWTAAELASAARRFFRDGYRKA